MEKLNRLKKKPLKFNGQEVLKPLPESQFYPFKLESPENKKKSAIDNLEAQRQTFTRLVEAEDLKINQQKNILAAALAAQEAERNNISRALHDSVCQLLYGIKINLQCIPDLYPSTALNNVNKLLDQAIKETRDISYALTPSVLMDFGFTTGIREISQRLSTANFKINTILCPSMDKLNPAVQLYLFRIVQELINNCIKHAAATEVHIRIKEENERIKVVVSDNGKGFQRDVTETFKNGSGLRSIKNQILLLDGELLIKSNKKRTTVCFTFKRNVEF